MTVADAVVAAGLSAAVLVAWSAVVSARRRGRASERRHEGTTEQALRELAERSLELGSLGEILACAAQTAQAAFQAARVVVFEPGAREGAWDVTEAGGGALEPLPEAARPVFVWFKHNAENVVLGDAASPRYGALRLPLGEIGRRYGIDVLVPLTGRGQVLAVLGLGLAQGRRPTAFQRSLLEHFRIEAAAAAINVRLHREAAVKLTLEKEVDLAGAVQLALVPAVLEGALDRVAWVGHYRPSGQAGSDFWSAYDLGEGRLLVVIGDVLGTGLAGSMASAVAKSCCDSLNGLEATFDAGGLLSALNRALYRPSRPIHMSCLAAIFDPAAGVVRYANAGHPAPYLLRGGAAPLGVLAGSGPMLGDGPDTRYRTVERRLSPGDLVLLYTDGIVEATDGERRQFGDRRLQRLLLGAPGAPPSAVRDRILGALAEFRGASAPSDDEVLVAVQLA